MSLRLESISKLSSGVTHLSDISLELQTGEVNILLGRTLAGKTSLMRIMAGLDRPSSGRIIANDVDVTQVPVRERNLAMVYQQFINYPSLTVFENIASPLRLQKKAEYAVRQRVSEIADALHLAPYLDRRPSELSGGQQQRTALARALAKNAELLLLDEPLVNLDYKLREELRTELSSLFRSSNTTVVYATTEPQEALQLGGFTAVLHEGKVLQVGKTLDVFNRPINMRAARVFSDPPINVLPATLFPSAQSASEVGIRSHHVRIARDAVDDIEIKGSIELAEISGSETYAHIAHQHGSLVAQLPGVHEFDFGAPCSAFINPAHLYGFAANGDVVFYPGETAWRA